RAVGSGSPSRRGDATGGRGGGRRLREVRRRPGRRHGAGRRGGGRSPGGGLRADAARRPPAGRAALPSSPDRRRPPTDHVRIVTRAIPALERLLDRAPDHVWMSPDISLWGWGEAVHFDPGTGPDRIQRIRSGLTDLHTSSEVDDDLGRPGTGLAAFISVTFATTSPGSVALVPRLVGGRAGDDWWMTTVDSSLEPPDPVESRPHPDRARYAGSSVPDVLWLEAVSAAIDEIHRGAYEKIVLARDYAVWSRHPFSPATVLASLVDRFPSCQTFRVADLVGASPEVLVRRRGTRLSSLVLAGSTGSHADAEVDRAAGNALLDSKKDRWEHELAVRSVREALDDLGVTYAAPEGPELL